MQNIFKPIKQTEALYNCCIKYYPDGAGGFYPVKKVVFDHSIYNPNKYELVKKFNENNDNILDIDEMGDIDSQKDKTPTAKSFYRARQKCFDYLMCNFDLDTFVTFTVDPKIYNSMDYDEICSYLSVWLSNRVRRNSMKYILVPERHKSGAIHFHGIVNFDSLNLVESGYYRYKKYTLTEEEIPKKKLKEAQKIYNVKDLRLGFSTAIHINGENAQEKVSKYIWKYMTKQGMQTIGGRFYLHGGKLETPKLVYSNESFENSEGVQISYGSTALKIYNF